MKKGLKMTLIFLCVLVGMIILDTIQAKIFNRSPLLKIRENLNGENYYIDKGLFVNHYHCNKENLTTWKDVKFACSLKDNKTEKFDFYLYKPEIHNDIRFNIYYENKDRKIYLAGNIGEFYIKEQENNVTLKNYLSTTFQTFDDGIKHITDKLDQVQTYRDGGTKVYKSKDKDITFIACNKINGNKNIYIGDYSLEFEEDLCD